MSSQVDVLYLNSANNSFNHVLAIFTRASEPATLETDASAFVGDGLVLRDYPDQNLKVPASEIGIFSVPFDSSYLAAPRNLYAAIAPGQTKLSQLCSYTNPVIVLSFAPPSTLTIFLTGPTPVLILVEGPTIGKPQPQLAKVATGSQNVLLAGLAPGNSYSVLVFAPQYPIAFYPFST
jgi:hypothetical protein